MTRAYLSLWFCCAVLWLALTFPVAAQTEPYCDPKERSAPDGQVVELGGRYFRICDSRYHIGSDRGVDPFLRLPFDSSHVTRVLERYEDIDFLWGRLILRDLDFEYPSDNYYTNADTYVGDMMLADTRYMAYYDNPLSEADRLLFEKGNMSKNEHMWSFPLLVYAPRGEAKLKPHIISCRGGLKGSPRKPYNCHFYLDFDEERRLVAHTRLLWDPVLSVSDPLDFNNLHTFLNALVDVFESIEVAGPE